MTDEKPSHEKSYRGPPPRKDLVRSPMKDKDWKGNEIFKETANGQSEEDNRRNMSTLAVGEVGITPGLMNGVDDERPVSRGREYDSEFAKLSLQGGHKDLIITGGGGDSERRHKKCENLSDFNKMSKQGGHKDLLWTDTEPVNQPSSGRKEKGCDMENLSSYNKLSKTGGHKDLLRMDMKPLPPHKVKGCDNISEYCQVALHGGHKDLLKLEGVTNTGKMNPKPAKKVNEEDLSDYARISLQGGHKDILRTDRSSQPEKVRKQKGCDDEQLSKYNKLAKTGGHKNLLKHDIQHDLETKKTKGCANVSDYSKMALQGGHKDLLVIEENKPTAKKADYQRKGGDWFEHNNNNKTPTRPVSAGRKYVQNGHRNQSSGILPGSGSEERAPKVGKKRFETTHQRSEAPFATNW